MDGSIAQPETSVLMERGQLCIQEAAEPQIVRRGMHLLTSDGCPVGFVAAIVIDSDTAQVTHLLLTRRCPGLQYQMVPVTLVAQVIGEQIRLCVALLGVERLPSWPSSG